MTTDVGPPMTGKPHDSNEIQADRSEYFTIIYNIIIIAQDCVSRL